MPRGPMFVHQINVRPPAPLPLNAAANAAAAMMALPLQQPAPPRGGGVGGGVIPNPNLADPGAQQVDRIDFAGLLRRNGYVAMPGYERLVADQIYRQASISKEEEESPRIRNLALQEGTVTYRPEQDHPESPGVYVSGRTLSPESNYFEVEILDKGASSHLTLSIGIVSRLFSLDNLPGRVNDSFAFCPGDGLLFRSREVGSPFGPRSEPGDKIGCGIKFLSSSSASRNPLAASFQLFFTHNGKEIGVSPINIPPGGFFPALSIHSVGESARIRSGLRYIPEEDIMMMVDSCEDDWLSLHDIRLNGPILEYVGRGKSVADVGLAQAKHPICTRHRYFEIEIIDPGLRCYISIGLARKDYPKNRHPGWQRGSIGYHADDGKVFAGSGAGAPFGPRCHKGDIMGCGVIFPRNYEFRSDSDNDDEIELHGSEGDPYPLGPDLGANLLGAGHHNFDQLSDYPSDSADDEDWWNERQEAQNGMKVNIYFTRNGNIIGKREVRIPKGGFYPTVGMMSSQEKVRVDLRPLSG